MINALHLLWIVPLAVAIGYSICCILTVGKEADERMDEIMSEQQRKNIVLTINAEQNISEEHGSVTIIGTDQYGNEKTETIPVPGVSKNKYVNIKKER